MKSLACIVICVVESLAVAAWAAPPTNPFYAMDTAFAPHFRKTAPPLDESLALVKKLGYDGTAWVEWAPDVVKADIAQIEKHGLRMVAIYSAAKVTPEGDISFSANAEPLMQVLASHCDIFWLHIGGKGPAFDALTAESPIVAKLRSLAETAKKHNLKIAVYPHLGEWTAKFADAVRLANLVDRPNFGLSFNLCHALAAGEESQIPALLKEAGPRLVTATICGADRGVSAPDKQLWKKLIQPLGQGSYDVTIVLRALRGAGFSGPIGFQGYGIVGSPTEILTPTMEAWRKLSTAP